MSQAPIKACVQPLARCYDVALLDLDGVCFAGESRVEHASEGVNGARALGLQPCFVTNNAYRAPSAVVTKLAANDIEGHTSEVFTAAMDGAALLREHVEPGARVLVVGGDGLVQAVTEQGYQVVTSAADEPAAVVQGWAPEVDWAMLSEGAYAISAGALHVATNTDATLPTERGFALGNGSLVAAIANATGQEYLAGGKPFPGIYRRALQRVGGSHPLAVGDRLGTDIVGARGAGIDSLHVLTGVSSAREILLSGLEQRPSFLHTDLRGLLEPHPQAVWDGQWWVVGGEHARVVDGAVEVAGATAAQDGGLLLTLNAYRAAACAVWSVMDEAARSGAPHDQAAPVVPQIEVLAPDA